MLEAQKHKNATETVFFPCQKELQAMQI